MELWCLIVYGAGLLACIVLFARLGDYSPGEVVIVICASLAWPVIATVGMLVVVWHIACIGKGKS